METEYLEVPEEGTSRIVPLVRDEMTIGRTQDCDVALPRDPAVSGVHAAIRRYGHSWRARDLGSANGTFVNGRRLQGEHGLQTGDEILVGSTTVRFRSTSGLREDRTAQMEALPGLTAREREILIALCRPAVSGNVFIEPASVRVIAQTQFVTEAAVKQHLLRLYDKFRIPEGEARRTRLANEAFRRGVISKADLSAGPPLPPSKAKPPTG
jgi:DNA-binding CsgD family transcriptional regulator